MLVEGVVLTAKRDDRQFLLLGQPMWLVLWFTCLHAHGHVHAVCASLHQCQWGFELLPESDSFSQEWDLHYKTH